jgi:flagellin
MAITVNTNVSSLNAQRNLVGSGKSLSNAIQRLSSGLRINSAKDDAAGLAISNKMTAQIRGLNQAVRNANDGISMAQTAEGAMQEITNALQRMREIAVQSASDTNTNTDRTALHDEFDKLRSEIQRISDNTKFNGTYLLNGAFSSKKIHIGADASQTLTLDTISDVDASGLSVSDDSISTQSKADNAISAVDTAIAQIDSARSKLGASQSRLESTISNLSNISENQAAARSRVVDADFAAESAAMTKAQILQQAGTAMLAQANMIPQAALSLIQ